MSSTVSRTTSKLFGVIHEHISESTALIINELFNDKSRFRLKHIRRSAKDLTSKEVNKELTALSHFKPHIEDIDLLIEKLQLSPHNVDYYVAPVDFYTITKLRRFDQNTQPFTFYANSNHDIKR